MANTKQINSRMQQKHDIEANWKKATGFCPMAGEIIVYDPDEKYSYARIKIGDEKTNVNDLPFVSDEVLDRLASDIELYYCSSNGVKPLNQVLATDIALNRLVKHIVVGVPSLDDMIPGRWSWMSMTIGHQEILHVYIDILTGIAYRKYERHDGEYSLQTLSYAIHDTHSWDMGFINNLSEATVNNGIYAMKKTASSIIDVETLPKNDIDSTRLYRTYTRAEAQGAMPIIYVDSIPHALTEFCKALGWDIVYHTFIVDALPETL